MKKGLKFLLFLWLVGIVGVLCYCLPTFSFGEVLEKEGVEGYREAYIYCYGQEVRYQVEPKKIIELLFSLSVRKNIGGSHWYKREHIQEENPQVEIVFYYGEQYDHFRVHLCEREVSFQRPGGGRFSDFDFNTYLIATPEDYESFIEQLGKLLEQSPSEPL